jgi:hypothetical protein
LLSREEEQSARMAFSTRSACGNYSVVLRDAF